MLCQSLPIYMLVKMFALIGVGTVLTVGLMLVMFKVVGER